MAKIQIKSEKLTPFGGIFSIMEKFDSMLSPVIDSTLGQRCSSIIGYQFSQIVRSLMSVLFLWRQGTYLWRHEQRIRLEQAPQVVHGGEYCLSSAYCIDTQFLQDHHEQAWHQGFWAQENESHRGFCLQIHLRTCQVDHDCKAIRDEYLHREPRLCKTPFKTEFG